MRVLVNDKPADALTARVEKSLRLAKPREQAEGMVMTAAAATNYYVAHTRKWFVILGAIAVVLMIGIAIVGVANEPGSAALLILSMVAIGGCLGLFLWWLLRIRVRTWNKKLGHRSEGLSAAGTKVSYDANGLTLDAETFAWPTIAVEQVEISLDGQVTGDTSETVTLIERLALKSGSRRFVLDRQMMQNGIVVVDNVWLRVRPRPA